MRALLLVFYLLVFQVAIAQNAIIPKPVSYESTTDLFMLDSNVDLYVNVEIPSLMAYTSDFRSFLAANGVQMDYTSNPTSSQQQKLIKVLLLENKNEKLGDEGYMLDVAANEVKIQANQPKGAFNAFQTLKQLLPKEFLNTNFKMGLGMIPGCSIVDYPAFSWRGLMLDVSRHFFTVEEVKQYIDVMADYKFNVLHWHLTDDEGWRIEIKSLPKLTEVGAWRVPREGKFGAGRAYPEEGEKATEGGFYTQEQIRDVIQYAQKKNITIIPEIDVPGHSMALLAAYPELSTKKEPKFVNPGAMFAEWYGDGTFKMLIENTLNPADEKVYEALDKIMTEVAQLFPAEYIHMGGDECYHGYWEESPEVQKFMKKNKIANSHELQAYFVKRVQDIIQSKGKKMIGWDEIMEGGLDKSAAVMNWRSTEKGIEAVGKGHKVVMTPKEYVYLDYTQGDHSLELPIYADLSLSQAYRFNPTPEGLNPDMVMGGQGNLWTEQIKTLRHAFYMTYPRAFAIVESLWNPAGKNYTDFLNRVENHFTRFEAADLKISTAVYDPIVKVKMEDGKLMAQISSDVPNTQLHYTYDNSHPDRFSPKVDGVIEIPPGELSLRVINTRNGKPLGRNVSLPRTELERRAQSPRFQF